MPHIVAYKGVLPTIDDSAYIAETAVVTGDVTIGADSSIWYGCVVRGDVNAIRIGAGVNIQDGSVIHVARPHACIIEDRVSIGHMALIHACTLEEGCFVGMKACVMDGAVVEKGAFVAAGALVTPGKRILAGELWAGQPARFVRKLRDSDREIMAYTQPNYTKLGQAYKAEEKSLSPRVQALEEIWAHNDSEGQDLSDMVNQQWKRLEALERDLTRTNERIVTLEDDLGGDAANVDQKPPHW